MSMGLSSALTKPSSSCSIISSVHRVTSTSSAGSSLAFLPRFRLGIPQYGLRSTTRLYQREHTMKISSSINPVPPPSSTPPSPSSPFPGKRWIAGLVISMLLPFLRSKWGPLFTFKTEVDKDLQRIEDTVEVLERVAERVEKVAEDVAADLPEGRLKKVATEIEQVADIVAKTAHFTDKAIDKVQELEERVESYVEKSQNDPSKKHGTVNNRHDKEA